MTFNKFSQPLFVDVNITVRSAFDGFAMVENENVDVTSIETSVGITADRATSGIASIGSIIKSFQKRPFAGSSFMLPSFNSGSLGDIALNNINGAIASTADFIADNVPGLNTALDDADSAFVSSFDSLKNDLTSNPFE